MKQKTIDQTIILSIFSLIFFGACYIILFIISLFQDITWLIQGSFYLTILSTLTLMGGLILDKKTEDKK